MDDCARLVNGRTHPPRGTAHGIGPDAATPNFTQSCGRPSMYATRDRSLEPSSQTESHLEIVRINMAVVVLANARLP